MSITIPIPEQAVALPAPLSGARINPQAAGAGFGELSAGAEHLARHAGYIARRQEEFEAASAASKAIAETRFDMTKTLRDQQQAAPEGAQGFTDGLLKSFDDYAQAKSQALPEMAQGYYNRRASAVREELGLHALNFEASSNLAMRQSNLDRTVALHTNTVRSDETQFEGALGEVHGAIAAAGLPPEQLRKAKGHADNLMATALFQGILDRDPKRAQTMLGTGQYDEMLAPPEKNALLERASAGIQRQQAEAERATRERQATLRAVVTDQFRDAQAMVRDTGKLPDTFSPGLFRQAYPADQFGDYASVQLKRLERDGQTYTTTQAIGLQSAAEDRATLDRFQPQGSRDYADQAQNRDLVTKAIGGKWQAIAQDPVAYAQQVSPALKAAFDAAAADPTKMPAAISLARQIQTQWGIPGDAQAVMSDTHAQALVGRFNAMPPDQAGAALTQTAQAYGDDWPRAFGALARAKLAPAYQVVASVENPAVRTALLEAVRAGRKPLEDLAGADGKAVKTGIADAMQPFVRTLSPLPNGGQLGAAWQDGAELLALRYLSQGASAGDAARRAASDLTAQWDLVQNSGHNARAPKGLGPRMEAYGDQVLQGLKPGDVWTPPSGAPLTDAQRGDAYFRDGVRSGAQWITSPGGDGWLLRDSAGNPVLKADKTPLTISFKDAATLPAPPLPTSDY